MYVFVHLKVMSPDLDTGYLLTSMLEYTMIWKMKNFWNGGKSLVDALWMDMIRDESQHKISLHCWMNSSILKITKTLNQMFHPSDANMEVFLFDASVLPTSEM